MLKDLKIDMPAVLALIIMAMFAVVAIVQIYTTGKLDEAFKQALIAVVMIAVGFYLGSSTDSRKKTDLMKPPSPPAV